jgi:hypothetical protein
VALLRYEQYQAALQDGKRLFIRRFMLAPVEDQSIRAAKWLPR